MPISRQQTHQMVHEAALKVLGKPARTQLLTTIDGIDAELDQPLRLRAEATPSAKLVIAASKLTTSDGGGRSAPIADDTVGDYAETTVNMQTAAIVGGTVTRDGSAFSLPTGTIGQFRIMAAVYKALTNTVDTTFSAEAASVGALVNPGSVFSTLDGTQLGYVILEATASTAYKTAGSATAVIEDSVSSSQRIIRFGAGSSGASTDKSFNIASIATPTATTAASLPLTMDRARRRPTTARISPST